MKRRLRSLVFSSVVLKTLFWITLDQLAKRRQAAGSYGSDSGAAHAKRNVAESLAYIEKVFEDYRQYGELERFNGRVAELGPGDNAGVAMLIRAAGADHVDLVDRFYSIRALEQQQEIYEALARVHKLEWLRSGASWDENALKDIVWIVGESAEDYFGRCQADDLYTYDHVISRAVLEHVMNPIQVLDRSLRCLKPGGKSLHAIDFRDHSLYSEYFHELTFLNIPGGVYPWMVRHSAGPNRVLLHRYRNYLEVVKGEIGLRYDIHVTSLASVGELDPYPAVEQVPEAQMSEAVGFVAARRHRFATEFRNVSDADLAVTGIFLVVEKIDGTVIPLDHRNDIPRAEQSA